MKRVSRPDTLHTELAELRRRLRLLETSSARRAPGQPLATPARAPGRSALFPARPEDWWVTDSATWERLAVARLDPGPYELAVTVLASADDEARGQVRVTVDGGVASEEVLVAGEQIRHVLAVAVPPGGREVAVEARRIEGDGWVRVYASL